MEIKNDEKYKTALQLINEILVNLNKSKVDDLTEFKDIDRDLLVSPENKKTFSDMSDILFDKFDRVKCGWYRRTQVKDYILTFLRCMCTDLGLQFTYEQRDITKSINGKNYRKTHTFYFIKK